MIIQCKYDRVMCMKKKVFIGMSGGVDSSVSALLLKNKGYDVTGVFIKAWQPDFIECTWKEDRLDAMRVAALIDIPFVTLDLEKEYKEGVIDYMIEEYRKGNTPNPDVMCNREIKFGAFYAWVKMQDKDAYIATGHYAEHDETSLIKSKDDSKDQTYFLWTITKDIVKNILFPIGAMEKSQVRELARDYNLPVSDKKDSQGLCFVGTIDIKSLLKNYIQESNGNVITEEGEVIGKHTGVMFFTIGERHGFTITKKSTSDTPYFIISKNLDTNAITVSHTPPREDIGEIITLEKMNWTHALQKGDIYEARARYRAPLTRVEVLDDSHVRVLEDTLTKVKGQSLVLYDGVRCIGGGIIM